MARKFVTVRELAFINAISKELLQRVVGEEIIYYAISLPETQVDELYGESIKKTWCPPVRTNALVLWDDQGTKWTGFGSDSSPNLEVYLHTEELIERNISPREGDFVEFGQVFFEITSVIQPQLVFGQVNEKILTKCACVPAREGQFQMGNRSSEDLDRTHPVEDPEAINR